MTLHRSAIAALLLTACHRASDPGALVPPTADQDPLLPRTQITVAGVTRWIHLETFGKVGRPTLFLLHDGPGGDFRALLDLTVLCDRYFVVAWDQRGSGLSERVSDDEISTDNFVEELEALCERFLPEARVTLVGHSWGAMYASLYASVHPDRVRQMVLMEPGRLAKKELPYDNTSTLENTEIATWLDQLLAEGNDEKADYLGEVGGSFPATEAGCRIDPVRSAHTGQWRFGARVNRDFNRDIAPGLDLERIGFAPEVLIIASDCAGTGANWQRANTVPLFANARVVEIPRANHSTILWRPESVDAMRAYLAEYHAAP